MPLSPKTSTRFQRAAAAERDRLLAQRKKLSAEVLRLEKAIAEVKTALAAITERIQALEALSGEQEGREAPPTTTQETAPGATGNRRVLRGAEIREMAVRALVSAEADRRPIQYREWLKLLGEFGFRVVGKRPEAVFLNQVVRSPLVRSTTQAGIYELDHSVPKQLRARLGELQREFSQLIATPIENETLAASSARQEELTSEIRRTRKALEETQRSLSPLDESSMRLAA